MAYQRVLLEEIECVQLRLGWLRADATDDGANAEHHVVRELEFGVLCVRVREQA